jgi:hypothetical protein
VHSALRCFDVVFGRGDDGYPLWLLTVRVNILLFLVCTALAVVPTMSPGRLRGRLRAREVYTVLALTALAAVLRFVVARPNLMDFGGIAYSRLLFGYKGYFATAQLYSLWYGLLGRDIEHGILLQRIAGTLTIPLVYALCRRLQPSVSLFPATAAFLFAVYPLHILFSASDALPVFSNFLAAGSCVLLAGAVDLSDRRAARLRYLAAFSGLALLTQVRYENVLLLIPAVLALLWRRSTLRALAPAVAVSAGFGAIYLFEAAASGLSYQNPVDLQRGFSLAVYHVALNPFLAIPVLLVGTAAIWAYKGLRWGVLATLPWVAAFILCVVTTEDGHGAARLFANWLILLLPLAGYGFSLMLNAPQRVAQALGVAALLCFAVLPVVMRARLTVQYLEILENDRFRALLSALPPGVEHIIVPDDEVMWRQYHSTVEAYRKYATILSGRPEAAQRVELVSLTDYLSDPQRTTCGPGACVFFFGIPCMEQPVFAESRRQCEELLRTHRTSVVDETTVVAAPFVACSIYTGRLKKQLCDPATEARSFRVYRIEG